MIRSQPRPLLRRPTRNELRPWLRAGALFGVILLISSTVIALSLLPLADGAAKAIKTFDHNFFDAKGGDLALPSFPARSTIYAANGSTLATVFKDENRKVVPLRSINMTTRRAVLAIEDHGFYQHGPVVLTSIIRAMLSNLIAGHVVQGGSTITQQLVKNTETGTEQTFKRKILEAQGAVELEQTYSKDQILELYLNDFYLGNGVYGVGTAAEYYFAKKTQQLNLPESALLAGMIASPGRWDPITHAGPARDRRNQVLLRMLQLGWITQAEHDQAVVTPIHLSDKIRNANTFGPDPYFVDYVKKAIEGNPRFGATVADRDRALYQGGLRIYTTLQPAMQEAATASVTAQLPDSGPAPPKDPESAVVSVVPQTGAIEVMVGGHNFSASQYNLATGANRGAGSAFKMFTLVAALEDGVPPGRVYPTADPVNFYHYQCPPDGWHVSNAEPATAPYLNLWDATKESVNAVFAHLTGDIGPDKIARAAEQMGLPGHIPAICSLTLGTVGVSPLNLTSAYSTLANNGVHCTPFAITKVANRFGKVIWRWHPRCTPAIDPSIAHQVTAMLEGVVQGGTGYRASIGRPVAGKTGTGQNFADAWFLGYVPQLTTGVWVGYTKQLIPMDNVHGIQVFGGTYPAIIWHDYMSRAVAGLPVEYFSPPPPQRSGTIPNVVNLLEKDAQDALAKANFTSVSQQVDSGLPVGTVITQSPAAGTSAVLGSQVTLTTSNGKGPPMVAVPNVVGQTEAAAKVALVAAGFTVTVKQVTVTVKAQDGLVQTQSPGAAAMALQGSAVTIMVGVFGTGPSPSPSPTPSPSPSASPT